MIHLDAEIDVMSYIGHAAKGRGRRDLLSLPAIRGDSVFGVGKSRVLNEDVHRVVPESARKIDYTGKMGEVEELQLGLVPGGLLNGWGNVIQSTT